MRKILRSFEKIVRCNHFYSPTNKTHGHKDIEHITVSIQIKQLPCCPLEGWLNEDLCIQ